MGETLHINNMNSGVVLNMHNTVESAVFCISLNYALDYATLRLHKVKNVYAGKNLQRVPISVRLSNAHDDVVPNVAQTVNGTAHYIKLMKGKALRKHSLHEKTAASVILKLFISSNEINVLNSFYLCKHLYLFIFLQLPCIK